MRKFLLFFFAFFYYQCWGQGNMITINSSVPSQLTVCGQAKIFTITIYNPSPFTLTNDTLKITMPSGVNYQSGSITGATESNINVLNKPVFVLADIPTLTTVSITYIANVSCDILPYLSGGGIIQNTIRVNYRANGTNNYDQQTTATYIIRQPNISISNFMNQSYSGAIGDVYTRCVTITNGGFGELSNFTLTDSHGSGLHVTAVSNGNWTNSGNNETVTLGGAQFAAIGDGDTLFENGESITICETVNVLNCISVFSAFEAYWGCGGQHCQSSTSNANVVFPNLIPNLVITPIAAMNSCIGPGNASLQQLKIVNTGLGKAVNLQLDIFQTGGAGSGYQASLGSYIDVASFTLQTGLNGSPSPITPTVTYATATLACMTSPKGRALLSIPTINPGDTVYIKWNTYSCCYNDCSNVGTYDINGWRYKGTYENICQSNYVITETWGRVYSRLRAGLANNGSPSTLVDGQTGTFNFLFTYYENNNAFPAGPGAYWKFVFTLPSCLTYSGNMRILRSNGVNTWAPTSVTTSGNTVTAVFNGAAPWSLLQAQVMLDLSVNCSGCSGANSGAVTIQASYVPNSSCTCEVVPSCQTSSVNVICPSPCPQGLAFRYFEMKRTSYGLPDNESNGGNGLPDPSGALDFSKIKTDRAMFGDTITSSFNGVIKTSLAYPSWQYCYASSSMSNGNRLTFVDAQMIVYRAGSIIAACSSFTPLVTNSGSTRIFKYNLSVATLGACLPGGFTYQNNDSIVFKPRYKVTSNIGNATPINCYATNEYYVSDIANPTLAANKFQCSEYNGNCTIIGYYFHNCCSDSYSVKSCDQVTINQNYYLSIGPCCNNYGGGNLFPYEYRNWANISVLTSILPTGYEFVSARFNQVRTAGTIATVTSPWFSLTPVNPSSDTLSFNIDSYYNNDSIPLSDDGFHGTLQLTVRPSCRVLPSVTQAIKDIWQFNATPFFTGTGSAATSLTATHDSIVYQAPDLFLQSTLPSINAPDMLATWDISISNLSNVSDALNTWLSGPAASGITIVKIDDLDNNINITPVGDIYQVGTVNAGGLRNFRITATFTSCLKDSILVFAGWNCNVGYPTSVQTYPCTPESIKLSLTPLMPALIVNITAPPGTIQLCDTATYTVEGVNVQLGTAYHVKLKSVLPLGVNIVPGSSHLSYPVSNPYQLISDPIFIGGTTWQWDISASDTAIGNQGLKGIVQTVLNKFKLTFKVVTNCGYTSGSTIAFNLVGEASCGQQTGQEVALSSQLGITGATTPYTTSIRLLTTYISPCSDNTLMRVSILNQGPQSFAGSDSVFITMPPGVNFVNGTFNGVHNPPANSVPATYTLNNSQHLGWKLTSGVAAGDSTVFEINYAGNPQQLSCGISQFEARTTSSTNVLCSQSGTNCGINIGTGDTSLAVFTYKAYLSLSNGSAVAAPNPPLGETITAAVDIVNTGQEISNGSGSILQFFYDSNGNGLYNIGDVFLAQDTIQISNNSTLHYSTTFNAPAGKACSIIATVQDAVNPCVCGPSQFLLHPVFKSLGPDTTICSGTNIVLGPAAINGYTYSWSPATGLGSAAVANPVLSTVNSGSAPTLSNYVLTTNRMGCTAIDTIVVTVNPKPVSNAGNDIAICKTTSSGSLGVASTSGYLYSWSPAYGLSDATVANPSVVLDSVRTTNYIVATTWFGCVTYDTVVVKVLSIPIATLSGNGYVCQGGTSPEVTFAASNGLEPYTFTYSINGAAPQTISTNSGSSITLSVPTTVADTFVYSLIGVQDSNNPNCSQTLTDSIVVIVAELPSAAIVGDTSICQGTPSVNIVFRGHGATSPYTFAYSVNGGMPQTVSSGSLDSAVVVVPTTIPGTYVYTLEAVQDGSPAFCNNAQSGTATVIVNPAPLASLTSSLAEVCKNASSPHLLFTGTMGTSPYTFTYSVNNGSPQTITTTSGDTVTLAVPANVADTLNYMLISVQDASSTACISTQSDVLAVVIHPLPTATISSNTMVCSGDPSPQLVLEGFNGTPPFAFTYAINGGAAQTLVSNTNTINVLAPTSLAGQFIYRLQSVREGSVLACSQAQQDSVLVVVSPKPTADFNVTEVCYPQAVAFTDLSTVTGDSIVAWGWLFETGAISVLQNPQYNFSEDGSYNVLLVVLTGNGCSDTIIKPAIVHPLPVPDFDGTIVCDGSITNFTDKTTINPPDNIQSWSWSFGNAGSSSLQSPAYQFSAAGKYQTLLVVTSDFGCVDSIVDSIAVNPNPLVNFSSTTTAGCEPLCVILQDASTISSGSIAHWSWDTGDGHPSPDNAAFEYCYTNELDSTPVKYNVTLSVTSDSGCTTSFTQNNFITVYPKPVSEFFPLPSVTTIINPIVGVEDNSIAAAIWDWDFGDGYSISGKAVQPHIYADTGHYTISQIITSTYGCLDTSYQQVIVEPDFAFYIPNAFSPNDDGVNDTFNGSGIFIIDYEMIIFDRWGNQIYKTTDYNHPWDGKVNGSSEIAQCDVYIYKIVVQDIKLNKHRYQGTVTLVK